MGFNGRWMISIPTPIGKQEVLVTIVDRNGEVSGTAQQGNETVQLEQPTIDGNRIQWSQQITKPMKLYIKFDLTRDDDKLLGQAKPGILPSIGVSGIRLVGVP